LMTCAKAVVAKQRAIAMVRNFFMVLDFFGLFINRTVI